MPVRILNRKGTAAQWTAANTVLGAAEFGFETDTGQFKIGDGTSTWSQLPYFVDTLDLNLTGQFQALIDNATADYNTLGKLEFQMTDLTGIVATNLSMAIDALETALTDYINNKVAIEVDDRNAAISAAIEAEAIETTAAISAAVAAEATERDLAISDAIAVEITERDLAISVAVAAETTARENAIELAINTEVVNRDDAIAGAIASEVISRDLAITEAVSTAITEEEIARDLAIQNAVSSQATITDGLLQQLESDAAADATLKADTAKSEAIAAADLALTTHNNDTTNVHGIADVADLATKLYADTAVSTHNSDTTNVHGILDTAELATKTYADDAVVVHNVDTTNVHGIANTAELETQTGAQAKADNAYATGVAYTDQEVLDARTDLTLYTDNAELAANQYTDNQITGALATAQGYADTAEADAKLYADGLAVNYEVAGAVSAHDLSSSNVHGVTGDVVGTTDTQLLTNKSFGSDVSLNGNLITDVATPVSANDAANKAYVDAVAEGLHVHASASAATTENIDIVNDTQVGDLIDGVTLVAGMRILVKNQTDGSQNGIYVVQTSGGAIRATDYDSVAEIDAGDFIYVTDGTINAATGWVQTEAILTLDSDAILFAQFSGSGTYTAGVGLNLDGSQFSVNDAYVATRAYVDSEIAAVAVDAGTITGTTLNPTVVNSSLTSVGTLSGLTATGSVNLTGATVTVATPTAPTQPTTKAYVDNAINQYQVEIKTIDDLSNYFDGYTQRFLPTYQGFPVTLKNPFNLMLTIDGIIQSVGYADYVWQSVLPRVGFRIDNDGYIAFPEPIPSGSGFDARILVGSEETTQTKVYPFKAADIVLGGY